MEKVITVRGVGKASAKSDTAVLTLVLSALDVKYDAAMAIAEKQLDSVRQSFVENGFKKDDIKTVDFHVVAEKKSVHDKNGNYSTVFAGYRCSHTLKITFDFDARRLGKALAAATACTAEPELNIAFTVKDKTAVSAAVLESAAKSAREKAEVLAAASGVKLGELVNIDYNFSEHGAASPTRFLACNADAGIAARSMEIEPEDVVATDSAAFTWTIE